MVTQELIDQALRGDPDSVTALIIAFIPIVRSRILQGVPEGLESDDLLQEGLMGLTKALTTYNSHIGVKFTTFATVCIDHSISSAIKKAGRKKHDILNRSVPLSEDETQPHSIEDEVEGKESAKAVLRAIETRLTPLERKILSCFLEGQSYNEIAQQCNITRKTVDNGMQRVRKKIKESGE